MKTSGFLLLGHQMISMEMGWMLIHNSSKTMISTADTVRTVLT